jgi:4-aminobutyrate aminotransferase-like enzyme
MWYLFQGIPLYQHNILVLIVVNARTMAPIALESPERAHSLPKDRLVGSDIPSRILHRDLHTAPQRVTKALGLYLSLENGQSILDATGGAAVACIGHGDDRVKRAIARQMDEVSYCHSLFFSSTGAEGLGRELVLSTDGKMSKAFIVSSG